jgi:holo-[acyl-carrier protein] synthase
LLFARIKISFVVVTRADTRLSVGADIVEVGRLRMAIGRFGSVFLSKIFTEFEVAYCTNSGINYCSISARFAAKEAFAKALGSGIGVGSILKWRDVAIRNQPSGIPEIVLSPLATDIVRERGFRLAKVSLSHTKTLAQAVVILMG